MSELQDYVYHEWPGVGVLYCADCLDVLPLLEAGSVDAVVTDPVWPNASVELIGHEDPFTLFSEAAKEFPRLANRLAVHLCCDTDPRFLLGVPAELPFIRTCWLEYACPSYKGRILHTGDVAYVFGVPPSTEVCTVIPGKCTSTQSDFASGIRHTGRNHGKEMNRQYGDLPHPCARRSQHVEWLVRWLVEGTVLDPFFGSGTTGVAAIRNGQEFIGIETHQPFCAIAASRIDRELSQPRLPFVEPIRETQSELFSKDSP